MEELSFEQLGGRSLVSRWRALNDSLSQHRNINRLGGAIGALLVTGMITAVYRPVLYTPPAEACDVPECAVEGVIAGDEFLVTGNLAPAVPQLIVPETPQPLMPEIAPIAGIDPEVDKKMRAMRLSQTGFEEFLKKLNATYIGYAAQKGEFNPAFNRKRQGPIKRIIQHYTVLYYNSDKAGSAPSGTFDARVFIDSIANRYGSVLVPGNSSCCAINAIIDRNGNPYLLTPLDVKVQHNPPYDIEEFGIELEAANRQMVNTSQYESQAYFNLLVMMARGLIDRPLAEVIRGHGEERAALLARNPEKNGVYSVKVDFNFPETELFRQILARFMAQNPGVRNTRLPTLP